MVGEEVDGRVLWKGGGQADFWVDFGKKLRAVVKAIVEGSVLGCWVECRVI